MKLTQERLIYGFDPLCGWCFAFRPTMRAVTATHSDLPITLAYGGLVVGARVEPIAAMRDYLRRGLAQVQAVSGATAGPQFYNGLLAEGTYISNSEPPCRAIYVVEHLAPNRAYAFADTLPYTFYGQGQPLDNADVLAALATAQGIDAAQFVQMWHSSAAIEGTQHAFQRARAAGIHTYPTLIYERDGVQQVRGTRLYGT
ncbi:MAG: DsbA family protein [Chloroflexaceae bacterium]|nr:DsbA family protein [Chloroflexaceae bacterium]